MTLFDDSLIVFKLFFFSSQPLTHTHTHAQVQDFRFLCPNGTAFDQEAQICADWGDVDCEAATLYYGSDNFDLYRLGSGFESKRAPFAEEEEATFHLQRAETSKCLLVDVIFFSILSQ